MKKYFIGISLVIGLLFFGTVAQSLYYLHQNKKLSVDDEVAAGKLIWQRENCMECHAIFGNGGYSASDLTKIMEKRDTEWLMNFFSEPPVM
ncbi:MAG: c-type cytochrome, partial [Bacillota bacterium]|nr:c-type cytochrome [Bacillota bacterium]